MEVRSRSTVRTNAFATVLPVFALLPRLHRRTALADAHHRSLARMVEPLTLPIVLANAATLVLHLKFDRPPIARAAALRLTATLVLSRIPALALAIAMVLLLALSPTRFETLSVSVDARSPHRVPPTRWKVPRLTFASVSARTPLARTLSTPVIPPTAHASALELATTPP